jgi:phosphate starvation-inducible PhoH-like protein
MSTKPSKGRGRGKQQNHNLSLGSVQPLTDNQKKVFESKNHVVLNGCAGTGKTFITSYLGLKAVLDDEFSQLLYIRSAVATRNIGFLPGNERDKVEVYERPYVDIAADLFRRGDAYEILKQKGIIKFLTTSFPRGMTLNDSVIIVDECQNMSYHELDSIITRIGENCLLFICGDYFQSDLGANGLKKFHEVLKRMQSFDFVEFGVEDIVRSDFVKEYLTTKYKVFGEKHVK